jgi:hypothetical protein
VEFTRTALLALKIRVSVLHFVINVSLNISAVFYILLTVHPEAIVGFQPT